MSTSATEFKRQRSKSMGTTGLADLANYYWLGERVLTVANECARHATARRGECGRRARLRGASAGRSDSDLNS